MSSRPKPRPRPRARAPQAAATVALDTDVPTPSSPGASSAVTSTPPPPAVPEQSSIDDEDALFMRNQSRTAQGWRKINKLAEAKDSKKRKSSGSDSSDSEHETGSSPRFRGRKVQKRTNRQGILPDWTRKRPDEIILSSDDSDEDILAPRKSKNPMVVEISDSPVKPGGRHRSRSRSLTPPPALSQYVIARAQEAVRNVVGSVGRAASPTLDVGDDTMDNIVSDPELASIARRVKAEAARQGGTPAPEGGGPENVTLRVMWKPHPLNPNGRSEVWSMRQKRHDNFHQLCAEIADLASIRSENVVLSLDGMRVFPSSTPHSVGIWAEAELEACDKITYDYLQENKRMRSESVAPSGHPHLDIACRRSPSRARSPSFTELSDSGFGAAESEPEEKDAGAAGAFTLFVVSEKTKGRRINLRVLPRTKCGVIVRKFLEKAGLQADYPERAPVAKGRGRGTTKVPVLSVDGEKMDPEAQIGEVDLEDGDQVEVVGL
ncbi:hypothetical protein BN946_scf184884.g66 [Trametes cinnabarina]|uniref:Uncharacterized protein n=1 Tax=Pycnoporus cinnabarinus TaxID=5643 RepID=A0A060S611_PYCCI|nr:hypothetical protein BN946_scf184884.g66 [Trametes cinnabarina]